MRGLDDIVAANAGAVVEHFHQRARNASGAPQEGSRTRKAQTYTNPHTGARVTVYCACDGPDQDYGDSSQ